MKAVNGVSAEMVALQFAWCLSTDLSKGEFRLMLERNAREAASSICHSHDFTDANMTMDRAMTDLGLSTFDEAGKMSDEIVDLWNDAWNIAKERHIGSPELWAMRRLDAAVM